MATPTFLEQFFDNIEDLPPVVRARFVQIRELDIQAEQLSKHTDKLSEDFLKHVKTMSPEEKKTAYDELQTLYAKAKALSDEKIQLADDIYELIDAPIRQLDLHLARFATELKSKKPQSGPKPIKPETENVQKRRNKSGNKRDKRKRSVSIVTFDGNDKFRSGKPKFEPQSKESLPISSEMATLAIVDEVEEMAIDPNEPTYCYCQKVSCGSMVCCDNPDCTIEWFHFDCVGLSQTPVGQWFCANCCAGKKMKK